MNTVPAMRFDAARILRIDLTSDADRASCEIGFILHTHRRRIVIATVAGAGAGLVASFAGLKGGAATLAGWDTAATFYLFAMGWILLRDDEAGVRARAAAEDENRGVIMTLVLCAVAFSFAAVVVTLREAKGAPYSVASALAGLSVLTLALSWLVVQVIFCLHYAHRYFGDFDGDGSQDGGVKFPGDPPTSYRDFVYMAVCMGATCQVSDFNITTSRFRSLVTTHALVAFLFNTMVLALGINIAGALLGQ